MARVLAFLILAIASLSCSSPPRNVTLPAIVAEWRMKGAQSCTLKEARPVCVASYSGTPEITFTVHVLSDSTTAFEAIQHWEQPKTGKIAFYQGTLFGVVEAPNSDLQTLGRFVNAAKAKLSTP